MAIFSSQINGFVKSLMLSLSISLLAVILTSENRGKENIVLAANNAVYSVDVITSQPVRPGGSVLVDVKLSPGGNNITSLRFRLAFPSDKLLNPVVTLKPFFSNQDILLNQTDSNNINVALGCGNPCIPYPATNGPTTVATIIFDSRSSASGTANLIFAELGSANTAFNDFLPFPNRILSSTTSGTVTFLTSNPSFSVYLPVVLKR